MKLFELITSVPMNNPENKPTQPKDEWDELFGPADFDSSTNIIPNDQARANTAFDNDIDAGAKEAPARLPNPTNRNMPTILGAVMRATGEVVPEWHEVKNLPGYLSSGVRSVGRQVFATFTTTPIENINVLAKLGAEGPNTNRELNAVATFVRDRGQRDIEAENEFHNKIVGYRAEVQVYKVMGHTFMLVKDQAGNYIYSWPTADGDGLTPQVNISSADKSTF
jgi:hypothetical protein